MEGDAMRQRRCVCVCVREWLKAALMCRSTDGGRRRRLRAWLEDLDQGQSMVCAIGCVTSGVLTEHWWLGASGCEDSWQMPEIVPARIAKSVASRQRSLTQECR
eukprot:837830-Rhodomonas_salina.2